MIITIAVIFVLLATFLLIIFNMYSDYVARREQDSRLIAAKARNIIAECEELLLNQAQVVFSKTLVLVLHYRIIRALKKRAIDPKNREEVKERIANEEKLIAEIKTNYKEAMCIFILALSFLMKGSMTYHFFWQVDPTYTW